MKKLPIFATMLLVMGVLLVTACDEQKPGTDPLVLAAIINNSQYYLEFDVDLDNDGTDDEHVEMGMRQPFDHYTDFHWYHGEFKNKNSYVLINIPDATTGPTTYDEPRDYFSLGYDYNNIYYASSNSHPFSLTIVQWEGIGGDLYAEFGGELNDPPDENIIKVSNGKVFAKISK